MTDARDAAEKRAREFFRREFGTILDQGETPRRPQLERALTALLLSWGEEQRKAERLACEGWLKQSVANDNKWLAEHQKNQRLTEELAAVKEELDAVRNEATNYGNAYRTARREAEEAKADREEALVNADADRASKRQAQEEGASLMRINEANYQRAIAAEARIKELEAEVERVKENCWQDHMVIGNQRLQAQAKRADVAEAALQAARDEIRQLWALRAAVDKRHTDEHPNGSDSCELCDLLDFTEPAALSPVESAPEPPPGTPKPKRFVSDTEATLHSLLVWAEDRKDHETLHRPDVNIYKRVLVATWDQVLLEIRTRLSGVRGIEEVPLPAPHSTPVPAEEPKPTPRPEAAKRTGYRCWHCGTQLMDPGPESAVLMCPVCTNRPATEEPLEIGSVIRKPEPAPEPALIDHEFLACEGCCGYPARMLCHRDKTPGSRVLVQCGEPRSRHKAAPEEGR